MSVKVGKGQTKPRYNEKPDGIFIYKIENQIFKVSIFFNQNAIETLQDKLFRVILTDQSKQAKGGIVYGTKNIDCWHGAGVLFQG